MSTLHTINKSPFSHTTLASCLQVCGNQDGILLLEDGVFGALGTAPCAEELSTLINSGLKVYALTSDVIARGLKEKVRDDISLTDYNGFVQLSIEHNCVQSWY
ncbi:protein TusB [Cellvibrio zantedeschiae]|uniref:Protein TusB n=1 Tax=Cellvibrio zantedeschiae TaxID=1237077 RepID=A0ABQ3AX07_9GAMM|nr:sulfurtransferase complex subunit TusB [Cellvibrio zantedeschiae]GGY70494.1 protein TusB [Cellvibrio zantedeschiae]